MSLMNDQVLVMLLIIENAFMTNVFQTKEFKRVLTELLVLLVNNIFRNLVLK